MAFKWNASPVAGNMAEQSMLYPIPLAGAWRIVTQFELQSCFVRKLLQGPSPQSSSRAVAAAAVSRDQQPFAAWKAFLPHSHPPASNRSNSELCRIVADSNRNTGLIIRDIIDAVRHGLAKLLVWKVVCCHLFRIALFSVRATGILHFSQRFLFFSCQSRSQAVPYADMRELDD